MNEDVYNPFSLINAFDDSRISDYWFRTGTPSFIPILLRKNAYMLENFEGARRREVREGFWGSLGDYYILRKPGSADIFDINLFVADVENGNFAT